MRGNPEPSTGAVVSPESRTVALAGCHGFCAGVRRAIDAVNNHLRHDPRALYLLRPLVHNENVMQELVAAGIHMASDIADIPSGAVLAVNAHGAAPEELQQALAHGIALLDATCPLVAQNQLRAAQAVRDGRELFIIGDADHPEIRALSVGLHGKCAVLRSPDDLDSLDVSEAGAAVIMQTTFNCEIGEAIIAGLKKIRPALLDLKGVCYATRNRRKSLLAVLDGADFALIAGSARSANTRELCILAEKHCPAKLISSAREVPDCVPADAKRIALGAGASTPESVIESIISELARLGWTACEIVGDIDELGIFAPPEIKNS